MRMIDADARVTVQSFDAMNEEYNHDEMTVEQALDFATDEGCPPTIDAIPVEWLEKHDDEDIRDSDRNSYGRRRISVVEALSMWKKEQEAQNG